MWKVKRENKIKYNKNTEFKVKMTEQYRYESYSWIENCVYVQMWEFSRIIYSERGFRRQLSDSTGGKLFARQDSSCVRAILMFSSVLINISVKYTSPRGSTHVLHVSSGTRCLQMFCLADLNRSFHTVMSFTKTSVDLKAHISHLSCIKRI